MRVYPFRGIRTHFLPESVREAVAPKDGESWEKMTIGVTIHETQDGMVESILSLYGEEARSAMNKWEGSWGMFVVRLNHNEDGSIGLGDLHFLRRAVGLELIVHESFHAAVRAADTIIRSVVGGYNPDTSVLATMEGFEEELASEVCGVLTKQLVKLLCEEDKQIFMQLLGSLATPKEKDVA